MVKADQFAQYVIRPALKSINLHSLAAEQLLLGTACAESKLGTYIHQVNGPALGVFQMEPATHFDLWDRYVRYRVELKLQLLHMIPPDMHGKVGGAPSPDLLITDLRYAAIMARLLYRRSPKPLPEPGDWLGMAMMWKLVYNTPRGKGTVEHFMGSLDECHALI